MTINNLNVVKDHEKLNELKNSIMQLQLFGELTQANFNRLSKAEDCWLVTYELLSKPQQQESIFKNKNVILGLKGFFAGGVLMGTVLALNPNVVGFFSNIFAFIPQAAAIAVTIGISAIAIALLVLLVNKLLRTFECSSSFMMNQKLV